MKVRASADVWAGLALLALAAVYFWQVEKIREVASLTGVVGARAFPLALAILLAIAGLALVARLSQGPAGVARVAPAPGDLRMLAVLVLFLAGYLALLPWLGFTITSALFLYGLFAVLGERRHWLAAPLALALALALYLGFHDYLGVGLPRGVAGF